MLNADAINTASINANAETTTVTTVALTGLGVTVGQGALNQGYGNLVGYGFASLPVLSGVQITSVLIGTGFATTPELYEAARATGRGFNSAVSLTAIAGNESFLEGRGFSTDFVGLAIPNTNSSAIGTGFSTSPVLLGAGTATGRSFATSPVLTADAPIFASLVGRSFSTTFEGVASGIASGSLRGRGFNSALGFSGTLIGVGFQTTPIISLVDSASFTSAFVMNVNNGQVSRYTNFPFENILPIGGKYYGVKADGLYLLEGELDLTAPIIGSITTKDDDFGDMQSKNVPFAYLGCDDIDISVTPIVDDYEYPTYVESFDGRKVKMARGIKGRYWRLRIDGIKRLQSIETLQETLARRVK